MLSIATVLTTIFTYVDDYCKRFPIIKPGPKPNLSNSEIITIAIFCELMGKTSEYSHVRFVSQWLEDYFPHMIDRSRYHRRLKLLTRSINNVRIEVLPDIGTSLSLQIIDSTPVPIISFKRAGFTPLFSEASYGHCAARSMTYYGFKLHLVTNDIGIPIHFDITPANTHDISVIKELLDVTSRGSMVLADKGYVSKNLTLTLSENLIDLWTPKRHNQKERESIHERKYFNAIRQKIEIVNGILKEQFQLENTLAKTVNGLISRIIRKLTAFTFGILINKLNGRGLLHISSIVN